MSPKVGTRSVEEEPQAEPRRGEPPPPPPKPKIAPDEPIGGDGYLYVKWREDVIEPPPPEPELQ